LIVVSPVNLKYDVVFEPCDGPPPESVITIDQIFVVSINDCARHKSAVSNVTVKIVNTNVFIICYFIIPLLKVIIPPISTFFVLLSLKIFIELPTFQF
jgi:hypothetical protein